MFHAELSLQQLTVLVKANALSRNAANVVCLQVATEPEKTAIDALFEKTKTPAVSWVTLRDFPDE